MIPPSYEAHMTVNADVVTGVDTEQEDAGSMALEAMEALNSNGKNSEVG